MTITISSQDPRGIKAVEIAADAGQWLKCRTRDGRKLYGVPSQVKATVFHLADCQACTSRSTGSRLATSWPGTMAAAVALAS